MARLTISRGTTVERTIDLGDKIYRVGRSDQSDIVLDDPNKAVSRLHAELRHEGGRYFVVDLNSQNGIWVEGRRVPQATLEPGVGVMIGPFKLMLESEPQKAPPAQEAAPPPPARAPAKRPEPEAPKVPAPPKPTPKPKPVKPGRPGSRSKAVWMSVILVAVVGAVAAGLYWPFGQSVGTGDQPTQPPMPGQDSASIPPAQPGADGAAATPPADAKAPSPQPDASAGQPAAGARGTTTPGGAPAQPPVARRPTAPPSAPGTTPLAAAAAGARLAARAQPPAARPAPVVAPSDPTTPPRRPGETTQAWRNRTRDVQTWFRQGATALKGRDYPTATARLEAVLKEAPDYPEAATLLADARHALSASAQEAFAAGQKLEKEGDFAGAAQQYERARQIDGSIDGVEQALGRLRDRLRAQGEDAYKRARQYDALGRTADAIAQYERALQLLPPDHELRKAAQERLDALKK